MSDEPVYIVGFVNDGCFTTSAWEPNSLPADFADAREDLAVAEEVGPGNPWAIYRLTKVDDEAGGTTP
jgi:hypothetical protein